MADAHILRIDSLPVVDRGNGIQTTPLITKELGSEAYHDGDHSISGGRQGSDAFA